MRMRIEHSLGTDFARRIDFLGFGGEPDLRYLFGKFIPYLEKVSQEKDLKRSS